MKRQIRRRDVLTLSALGVGGLALVKVGGRWLTGVRPPDGTTPRCAHLTERQVATVTAAALAMVGPRGEAAYQAGRWNPAADVDALLGRLPEAQRGTLSWALFLFEEWTPGWSGFSTWSREQQVDTLAAWRASSLGLKRSVWGFLHAATCSSFSGVDAGWEAMAYPGPCVGTGRPPGQSVTFTWDEGVP